MKAFLMHRDRDFAMDRKPQPHDQALVQDLELETLFNAMASGDRLLYQVARNAVLSGGNNDGGTILYRQSVLKDCLRNPFIARAIYHIAGEAIRKERKEQWGIFRDYPSTILERSIRVLRIFMTLLRELRCIADKQAERFESEGFSSLFAMLRRELSDEYFACVEEHLKALKFRGGVLISAQLGEGNRGTNYVLRMSRSAQGGWRSRFATQKTPGFTFRIAPRDESGARALSELRDRGIHLVANALAQSTDHILSFFSLLRTELAFYIGCLGLHGRLAQKARTTCFPVPVALSERRLSFRGLYDLALTFGSAQRVVANDVDADNKDLVIITGANQGGKSTLLRSIGISQMMMQCGMFAPAEAFSSNVCDGVFTHYKREEDATLKSGKLDEELRRMSDIVDSITSRSMVLFNESFAATNEREGAEIAGLIVSELCEKHVKMIFVTHLYEFARGIWNKRMKNVLFLRAEREADGRRTFKLVEGEPLQTSYGEDLYNMIFVDGEEGREAEALVSERYEKA
jgi:DNA mismatch repair ATPase MutS